MKSKHLSLPVLLIAIMILLALVLFFTNKTTPLAASQNSATVTIHNTTTFQIDQVIVSSHTFTSDPLTIAAGDTITVSVPADATDGAAITQLTLSGQVIGGPGFANSFNGLADDDTRLTIYLDEEMNMAVSANME